MVDTLYALVTLTDFVTGEPVGAQAGTAGAKMRLWPYTFEWR